jgi:hypothetical protein
LPASNVTRGRAVARHGKRSSEATRSGPLTTLRPGGALGTGAGCTLLEDKLELDQLYRDGVIESPGRTIHAERFVVRRQRFVLRAAKGLDIGIQCGHITSCLDRTVRKRSSRPIGRGGRYSGLIFHAG